MSARAHRRQLAVAVAGAFLAGSWEPQSMTARAVDALQGRRGWVAETARALYGHYPVVPADRPRELAAFIERDGSFQRMLGYRRPVSVRTFRTAPTRMGPTPWPVPVLDDVGALARWLAVDAAHLAWFADRRSLERQVPSEALRHYHRRWIAKHDGSARLLEAPKRELKELQRLILHGMLVHIPAHDAAHGFVAGRSVRTGASCHVGRRMVVRVDLESFFASVGAGRVYGVFRSAGYPEPVAHTLAALCTTVTPLTVRSAAPPADGDTTTGAAARRRRLLSLLKAPHLPQGAPSSPALANLAAHALDRRLSGLAARFDATYTRYADDLVFSADGRGLGDPSGLLRLVSVIAADEGLRVHPAKTRTAGAGQQQRVTGLVVNRAANVPRKDYDRLRATLHHCALAGPAAANRDGHPAFRQHLLGRITWAGAGHPARAERLARLFNAIDWNTD